MSGLDTDIQWFIARDGKQHGPVSDIELKKLVELSHLKPTDLLWRQGFADWRTATSVFPDMAAPRPAPAPSPAASPAPSPAQPAAPAPSEPRPAAPVTAARAAMPAPEPFPGSAPVSKQPTLAPGGFGAPSPATAVPALGSGAKQGQESWRPTSEQRLDAGATRPLGNPTVRTAGPFPAPGPSAGTRPDGRAPAADMVVPRREPERPPSRGRRALLVATGLLAMTVAGAWIASQYSDEIFMYVHLDDADSPEPPTVKADVLPSRTAPAAGPQAPAAPQQAAAIETALQTTPSAPPGVSVAEVDRKLQSRTMWVAIKQEFPEWYQQRVSETARLASEQKDQAEINRYLVSQLVALRRENARYALAASTMRHKELAGAFLANLKTLALESGDGCYDFISKGESSATIVARIDDPAKSAEIEAQMVAIVTAISEGRKQPADHPAPVKTDYDVLAGELGRLGWTQADMQLFANPKELAKAPRARVCSMLQDWFSAHLAIQDPSTQERLLFETLKPVISG